MKHTSFALAAIAAVIALALSGCGSTGSSIAQNASGDISQAKIVAIAANITIAETSDPASLTELTNEYVAAVQDAVSVIGSDQAKQKLTDMASQIAPHCNTCAQSLNTAAGQIAQ